MSAPNITLPRSVIPGSLPSSTIQTPVSSPVGLSGLPSSQVSPIVSLSSSPGSGVSLPSSLNSVQSGTMQSVNEILGSNTPNSSTMATPVTQTPGSTSGSASMSPLVTPIINPVLPSSSLSQTPTLGQASVLPLSQTPTLGQASVLPLSQTPTLGQASVLPLGQTPTLGQASVLPLGQTPTQSQTPPLTGPKISPLSGPTSGVTLPFIQTPDRQPMAPLTSDNVRELPRVQSAPSTPGVAALPKVKSPTLPKVQSAPVSLPKLTPGTIPSPTPPSSTIPSPTAQVCLPSKSPLELPTSSQISPPGYQLPSLSPKISSSSQLPDALRELKPASPTGEVILPTISHLKQDLTPSVSMTENGSMSEPVYVSPQAQRSDDVMDMLLDEGFIIEHRLHENGELTHLLVRTKSGDRVFLKVDSEEYRKSFPKSFSGSDLNMDRKTSVVLVPQEVKLGVLRCLELDICGAAFVCDNSVCMTEKVLGPNQPISFQEDNFLFRGNQSIQGGRIGKSLIAYPVVKLSSALVNPDKVEQKVRMVSKAIVNIGYEKLEVKQSELDEAVNHLACKAQNLKMLLREAESDLNREIDDLEEIYDNLKDLAREDLSTETQIIYDMVLRGLSQKKDLRTRLINTMSAVYSNVGTTGAISNELETVVGPILNEYMSTKGKVQ